MRRVYVGKKSKSFTFDVNEVEGTGTEMQGEKRLHYFAEENAHNEASMWRKLQGEYAAMARWRTATRRCEKSRRDWKVREDGVIAEVKRREQEGSPCRKSELCKILHRWQSLKGML